MTDDFDIEMDAYLAMTPAEQQAEERRLDAELDNMMREHCAWLESLPLARRVAYHRDNWLRIIRDNRRRLASPALHRIDVIDEIWRDGIRKARIELVKLRMWRATSIYPGEG